MFAPITLGSSIRVAESETFFFTQTAHACDATLPRHAHERTALSYVISGDRRYQFATHVIDCRAGPVVVIPAGEPHSTVVSGGPATGPMIESRFATDDLQAPNVT